ncbi:MAG TPA: hypothetical protein VH518_01705 [Tepidisphaeraceae bacterium]|jgi:hypothetical protein
MPPTQLAYAELPSRWGIALEREANVVRITIPPVPSWRLLPRAYFIFIPILALSAIGFFCGIWLSRDWSSPAINAGIYGLLLGILLLQAWRLTHDRLVFEVGPAFLSIAHMTRRGTTRRQLIPRTRVGEVKLNPSDGRLFIRVIGREFIELFVSPDRDVTRWIAKELSSAMSTIPISDARPVEELDPATGPVPPLPHGRTRSALLGATMLLVCAAAVVTFLFPRAAVMIWFAFLILAAVGVGIALGTQRKEYWQ